MIQLNSCLSIWKIAGPGAWPDGMGLERPVWLCLRCRGWGGGRHSLESAPLSPLAVISVSALIITVICIMNSFPIAWGHPASLCYTQSHLFCCGNSDPSGIRGASHSCLAPCPFPTFPARDHQRRDRHSGLAVIPEEAVWWDPTVVRSRDQV